MYDFHNSTAIFGKIFEMHKIIPGVCIRDTIVLEA